jgi:hypothetical protein
MANLVRRENRTMRIIHLSPVSEVNRVDADQAAVAGSLPFARSHDLQNAMEGLGALDRNSQNAGMGMGTAYKRQERHIRKRNVIDKATAANNKSEIFWALERLSDVHIELQSC